MTKEIFTIQEQIAQYIKDNLTIEIDARHDDYWDYSDNMKTLKVNLLLNGEVISSDYITVKLGE